MHARIRKGKYYPWLKFFFECGELDETDDRNNNGVIDTIDDTIDLMRELLAKGYLEGKDMYYLQLQEQMSQESRSYSAVSNVLKARHDTMKNAIGNIR